MSTENGGEHPPGPSLPIIEIIDGVHQIGDQTVVQGSVHYPESMTTDEVKEAMARTHGGDKDSYAVGVHEMRKSKFGKFALGFRKWNSSWDPHAEKPDPTLN